MKQKIKIWTALLTLIVLSFCCIACEEKKVPVSSNPTEERLILNSVNEFFAGFSPDNPDFGKKLLYPGSTAEKNQKKFPLKKVIDGAHELGINQEKISPYVSEIMRLYEFRAGKINTQKNTATVEIEATVPDIEKTVKKCMSEKMFGEYLKLKGKSYGDFKKAIAGVIYSGGSESGNELLVDFIDWAFPKAIKKAQISTIKTTLKLKKTKGKWLICDAGKIY